MIDRRQFTTGLGGATLLAVLPPGARAATPPSTFDLQASRASLEALAAGVAGWQVNAIGGATTSLWLRDRHGATYLVTVVSRDVAPLFEVFTLKIESQAELRRQVRAWRAPTLPPDLPPFLRRMMATRPAVPVPPATLPPLPFAPIAVEVLRRAEFVVPVDGAATVGRHAMEQSAVRPGEVPAAATAACEVAAGLLLTGEGGRRLLIAVDPMPLDLMVTQAAATIDAYVLPCRRVGLDAYAAGGR